MFDTYLAAWQHVHSLPALPPGAYYTVVPSDFQARALQVVIFFY